MQKLRHRTRLATIIILAIILLLLLCFCVILWFKTGEEASVGIFSLAVTLLGTIFIAIELKNGQQVTCSDMLINLNNYFHDSDRLMKVYARLEENELEVEKCAKLWADVESVEVAQYCTFFENLYLLYKNEIANIEDLDDLFGYRFFMFVHNPYIQEKYILPTSSSYVQIFKLYQAWVEYRKKSGTTDWQSRIPNVKYMFSEDYLGNRLYLHDNLRGEASAAREVKVRDREFTIRDISFSELSDVMALQERCVEALPDPALFYPLSREELLESMHLDKVIGAYAANELVGVAVIVRNREGARNLAAEAGFKPEDAYTFDAVMVDPKWRGYGLQNILIECAVQMAEQEKVGAIVATVSPDNSYSLNNFLKRGFEIASTVQKYGGLTRHIIKFDVAK